MFHFLKEYRRVIIIFILILFPLFSLSISKKSEKDLRWYDRVILVFTSPVQKAVSATVDFCASVVDRYLFLVKVKSQNKFLVDENEKLKEKINNLKEIEFENQRLRSLLEFKDKVSPFMISAEVIAKDSSNEFQAMKINKGANHGIKKRMAVVTPQGVVGQVINVTDNYSDILCLIDHNSEIDALVQRSRARGVLEGSLDSSCRLKYLSRTDDVVVGDMVITSGLGGVFPKGFILGQVSAVEKKKHGISQNVEMMPAVNFSRLEEVFVVLKLVEIKKDLEAVTQSFSEAEKKTNP